MPPCEAKRQRYIARRYYNDRLAFGQRECSGLYEGIDMKYNTTIYVLSIQQQFLLRECGLDPEVSAEWTNNGEISATSALFYEHTTKGTGKCLVQHKTHGSPPNNIPRHKYFVPVKSLLASPITDTK